MPSRAEELSPPGAGRLSDLANGLLESAGDRGWNGGVQGIVPQQLFGGGKFADRTLLSLLFGGLLLFLLP